MALSLTRLRGVQARRQLHELGGDAALANQMTPQSVSPLRAGTMQGARVQSERHRGIAYREQADLEAQREANIRANAELALRSKDAEFNRAMDERRMGMMEAGEERNAQLFPGQLEGQKFNLDEARKAAEWRATHQTHEQETWATEKEDREYDIARRKTEDAQKDTEFGSGLVKTGLDIWDRLRGDPQRREAARLANESQRQQNEAAAANKPLAEALRGQALSDAELQASPVWRAKNAYARKVVGLGVAQAAIVGEDGQPTQAGATFYEELARLTRG